MLFHAGRFSAFPFRRDGRGMPGMAILGGLVYRNEPTYPSSLGSATYLANAMHPGMTFIKDLIKIPGLENTIMDTHFYERSREGRMLVFLGRLATDLNGTDRAWVPDGSKVRGIASDESTFTIIGPWHVDLNETQLRVGRIGAGNSYYFQTGDGFLFNPGDPRPSTSDVDLTVNPDNDTPLADAFSVAFKTRQIRLVHGVIQPGPYYGDGR